MFIRRKRCQERAAHVWHLSLYCTSLAANDCYTCDLSDKGLDILCKVLLTSCSEQHATAVIIKHRRAIFHLTLCLPEEITFPQLIALNSNKPLWPYSGRWNWSKVEPFIIWTFQALAPCPETRRGLGHLRQWDKGLKPETSMTCNVFVLLCAHFTPFFLFFFFSRVLTDICSELSFEKGFSQCWQVLLAVRSMDDALRCCLVLELVLLCD